MKAASTPWAGPLVTAFAGIGVLSAMDAVIKHLGQENSPLAVTFFRYVFGVGFAVAPLLWRRSRHVDKGAIWGNAPRGLAIAVTAAAFFWGLSVLPLAEAITLTFIAPLLIPPMAHFILGEKMRAEALVACAIGFAGVMIAVQGAPSAAAHPLRPYGVAAVLFSAVTYALSAVFMRARAGRDGAFVVGLMGNIWPAVFLAGPVLVLRPEFIAADLPMMALAGVLGATGLYLLSHAYAKAQAQVLATMEYTALGWAAALGWAVFQEIPRWQTIVGALVIAGATLWAGWRNRRSMAPAVPVA